jgi:hypothetical protein
LGQLTQIGLCGYRLDTGLRVEPFPRSFILFNKQWPDGTNNLVTDWFGKLEIAKCNPWKGEILFRNIYSILGVKISGKINGNNADLILEAWKDCEFDLHGEKIEMKQGEIKSVSLNKGDCQSLWN